MGQTDRQTDKTSRWAFTAYEGQYHLFKAMPDIVAEWGYQVENCPDTQREHYQGYIRTKRQVRFNQIKQVFPDVHLEVARNWDALVNYCKKTDTAQPGTQVHDISTSKAMTMAQALVKLAAHRPYAEPLTMEQAMDEKFLKSYSDRLYWDSVQNLLEEDMDLIGLYSQPQYKRAWDNLTRFWFQQSVCLAEWGETDRQTDDFIAYAFED